MHILEYSTCVTLFIIFPSFSLNFSARIIIFFEIQEEKVVYREKSLCISLASFPLQNTA